MSTPLEMISITTSLLLAYHSVSVTIRLTVNNTILNNSINDSAPSYITKTVLPLGFPVTSLKSLIEALLSNDLSQIAKVPGITSEIALAAEGALYEAYSISFRHVWIAATCFCAAGLSCKSCCSYLTSGKPSRR